MIHKLTTRNRILIPIILGIAILIIASIAHHMFRMQEQSLYSKAYLKNFGASISQVQSFQNDALMNSAMDYSTWDEMGQYATNRDQEWAESNLSTAIQTSRVSFMIIYNAEGTIVEVLSSFPQGVIDSIFSRDEIFDIFGRKSLSIFSWIYQGKLFRVAAATVVNSKDTDHESEPQGYLLAGNICDSSYLSEFELATNSQISVTYPTEAKDPISTDEMTINEDDFSVIQPLNDYTGNTIATVTYSSLTRLKDDQRLFYLLTLLPAIFALLVVIWILITTTRLVSQPLKDIQETLRKNDLSRLEKIPPTNIEFHEIAVLIGQFFLSRKNLQEESEFHKKAEAQLAEYASQLEEVNRNKDKFFSVVAHDLRSPFNALLGYSDLLQTEYDNLSEEEKKKFIGIIDSTGRNIFNLLENLLQWSRIQTGRFDLHPEIFNLKNEVEDSLVLFQSNLKKKNITVELDIPASSSAYADPTSVRSILQNLISNAIKFSYPGQAIKIRVTYSDTWIRVSVQDSGVGMIPEKAKKLFEIGAKISSRGTEKELGSGLGLILCKELVEMNRGRIRVESEQGKGSVFTIELPTQNNGSYGNQHSH